MLYHRRVYLLPPELEDLFVADLWAAGTLGVRSDSAPDGRVRVEAYFGEKDEKDGSDERGGWIGRHVEGIELAEEGPLPETDWLARYRETVVPFPVAATLFVDPREPGDVPLSREAGEGRGGVLPVEAPAGRRLLRLPARAAFGTGSHESTSLAIELLEAMDVHGLKILDVGTGTGVLSFAALLFGARAAVGFDVDPAAPFHARDNCALNGLSLSLFAGKLSALQGEVFDLALVNVVPEQILPEMPALARLLKPAGEAILSGILAERGRQVLDRMKGLGFEERDRRQAGDWVAFRVARTA